MKSGFVVAVLALVQGHPSKATEDKHKFATEEAKLQDLLSKIPQALSTIYDHASEHQKEVVRASLAKLDSELSHAIGGLEGIAKRLGPKPAAHASDKKDETKPAAHASDKKVETTPAAHASDKKDEAKPAAHASDKKDEAKPAQTAKPNENATPWIVDAAKKKIKSFLNFIKGNKSASLPKTQPDAVTTPEQQTTKPVSQVPVTGAETFSPPVNVKAVHHHGSQHGHTAQVPERSF